jgi:hypothetical protein
MTPSGQGPGGAVLALCLGPSCAASYDDGAAPYPDVLRDAVRSSRSAVLVTTGCLGRCAAAAVAVVAHAADASACTGPSVWLAGVHDRQRCDALAAWVAEGGPAAAGHPDTTLPATLVPAARGIGAPLRLLSGRR